VMHLLGVEAEAADAALAASHGVIRRTVAVEPPPVESGGR
jgi:hypothetical protein